MKSYPYEILNGHHAFCNGDLSKDGRDCFFCNGPDGYHARFPMDCPSDELVKKYFPDAVKVSNSNENEH